ncbi:class I SAM-dependent methyltransferase [Amycolatopsis benzoatilytica]|uniref:class I SAM-dependent methyltransferase n=1 Tax=Amycolatopsis benzoatilytica TaxID=346045 RepID=UPI000360358F|nr:class I SAM-dependent methyltransferase [Amycolatopsis benzoatilytica]
MSDVKRHRTKLMPEMEGPIARAYARGRGTGPQLAQYREAAEALVEQFPADAAVLEVAPGPGYFSVELARTGRCTVTGLDVSRTFVQLAREYAREQGVSVDFRRGDVAAMPFAPESFDYLVCQAAFKNFADPVDALNEMHRVLRPGGTALVQDLNKNTTDAQLDEEVARMNLGPVAAFTTVRTLRGLRRRAYTPEQFAATVAESAFGACEISPDGIGLDARMRKA